MKESRTIQHHAKGLTAAVAAGLMIAVPLAWQLPAQAQMNIVMEEIVVQARLRSPAEQLVSERMDDDVAMDYIGSEFISRVGDSTVAAALRRMSGLSLVNGKFVYVRGLGERYSRTLLNGAVVPSPDLTRSVIPLDLFPTSIVDSLAVQKVYSADMQAAFGGGAVNIRTKSIPNDFTYGLNLGLGKDTGNASRHKTYAGGSDDQWGKDDGTRALPAAVLNALREYQGNIEPQNIFAARNGAGMATTIVEARRLNRELGLALNRNLTIQEVGDEPNYDLKGYIGNNHYLDEDWELGYLASASYKRGWDDTEAVSRNFSFPDERFEVARESTRKTDLHANINLGVRYTNDHLVETMSLYLRNTDDETAIRDFFNENAERSEGRGFREYRIKFEQRSLTVNQIKGEHYLGADTRDKLNEWLPDWLPLKRLWEYLPEDSLVNWKYSAARAITRIPNEVSVRAAIKTDPGTAAVLSSTVTQDTRSALFRFTDLEDRVENAGLTWVLPLTFGAFSLLEVSGGYEWDRKWRVYAQQQLSLGTNNPATEGLLTGELGQVYSDTNLMNDANNFELGVPGANNQSYLAATTTDAAFGKLDWTWDDTWRLTAGLRWEDYGQVALDWNINGYSATQPQVATDADTLRDAVFKDDQLYPSLALTWMTEWWAEVFQLRLGYSETVVRPDLREITDSGYIDPITGAIVVGKPGATPAAIRNIDTRAEWFFNSGDNLTLSLYHKDIKDPIEFFEAAASDTNTAREIINAEQGEIIGLEVEVLKSLGFLEFMGDWGEALFMQGNLTLQETEITAGSEADAPTNPVRPMTGASEHVVNLIIGFDSFNAEHAATLSYNVFGERLYTAGRNGAPDSYEQPFHSLDFTYTWYPTDFITVKFRMRNLLDEVIQIEREGVEVFAEAPGQQFVLDFQWDY